MQSTLPTDPRAFVQAVRYRDAVLRSWARRTGRMNKFGALSYRPEDVPPYIQVPTNEERSRAEVYAFKLEPLPYGQTYTAYLMVDNVNGGWIIATWTGEQLARVTRLTMGATRRGFTTDRVGSFWAVGVDGRMYYGRHNGAGMYCRMRLAKIQTRLFDLYWSPEGKRIAQNVRAKDERAAIRKAPPPYRRFKGEIYAVPAGQNPAEDAK